MTRIVSEVLDAFRAAGASEETARAAAAAIPDTQHLATKADVAELHIEVTELRAEMRAEMKLVKFIYGPIVILLLLKLVFFP